MTPEIKKIYEAHLAFELAYFQKKNLKTAIKEEVAAAFKWLDGVKLKDISSADKVKSFLERNVKEYNLSEEQRTYIHTLANTLHEEAKASKHTVSDYLSEARYQNIADKLIQQKEWRDQLIESIVQNPLYGEMIADTLYDGIKAFAVQSGPSNESVGGSLFNLGKGILGAALSGVSDTIDKNIKRFIADNLSKTLKQSEQHLKDRFSEANLRASSSTLWSKLEGIKIKSIAVKIKPEDISGTLALFEQLLKDMLLNEAVKNISDKSIEHFFAYANDKSVASLLQENNIPQDVVIREIETFMLPVIEKANADGYLKERIEARLLKFYSTL